MAGSLNSMSKGRGRNRKSFRPSSEINVTPLVDVMLVLLIIFMVTAPMLTVGVPVDLPKTQAAKMNDQVEPIVVSIDAQGKTFFQEAEMSLDLLVNKLTEASKGNPETKIYIRGDQKLSYGQIMEIMGSIAAAGFNHVSLIAEMPTLQPQQKPATPTSTKKTLLQNNNQRSLQR